MRVGFDARGRQDTRGIGRYVRSLLDALRATAGHGDEVVEIRRPRRVDVHHSPWIDGALLHPPCPMVVTLHDLVPLKRRGEYLRTGLRFRLRYRAVQRATRVIVPTHAVARDADELLGLGPDRVDVVAVAPATTFRRASPERVGEMRRRYELPEDYLLWVGGLEHPDPRKRVADLARTPHRLPLVLVGRPGRWAQELQGVHLTGHVPDEDLAAIYTGAHALVFPSDDEGFGLPPVEALACGTPVVASDVPAVREVLDGRATLVDPADVAALLAAAERAERPAPEPPRWTWHDAARATWRVYEEVSASSARSTSARDPHRPRDHG